MQSLVRMRLRRTLDGGGFIKNSAIFTLSTHSASRIFDVRLGKTKSDDIDDSMLYFIGNLESLFNEFDVNLAKLKFDATFLDYVDYQQYKDSKIVATHEDLFISLGQKLLSVNNDQHSTSLQLFPDTERGALCEVKCRFSVDPKANSDMQFVFYVEHSDAKSESLDQSKEFEKDDTSLRAIESSRIVGEKVVAHDAKSNEPLTLDAFYLVQVSRGEEKDRMFQSGNEAAIRSPLGFTKRSQAPNSVQIHEIIILDELMAPAGVKEGRNQFDGEQHDKLLKEVLFRGQFRVAIDRNHLNSVLQITSEHEEDSYSFKKLNRSKYLIFDIDPSRFSQVTSNNSRKMIRSIILENNSQESESVNRLTLEFAMDEFGTIQKMHRIWISNYRKLDIDVINDIRFVGKFRDFFNKDREDHMKIPIVSRPIQIIELIWGVDGALNLINKNFFVTKNSANKLKYIIALNDTTNPDTGTKKTESVNGAVRLANSHYLLKYTLVAVNQKLRSSATTTTIPQRYTLTEFQKYEIDARDRTECWVEEKMHRTRRSGGVNYSANTEPARSQRGYESDLQGDGDASVQPYDSEDDEDIDDEYAKEYPRFFEGLSQTNADSLQLSALAIALIVSGIGLFLAIALFLTLWGIIKMRRRQDSDQSNEQLSAERESREQKSGEKKGKIANRLTKSNGTVKLEDDADEQRGFEQVSVRKPPKLFNLMKERVGNLD
ncbi:MAG: hypothetical protein MHMPM18_000793 [Marteilia pararefringens]